MGAPKQKWTQEEESALRCGVIKHGPGKWRTILKDSDFSEVLYLRSNVDLKDKWRNMSVIANGLGSREKSKLAVIRTRSLLKHEDNSLAIATSLQSDDDYALQVSTTTSTSPGRPNVRLDNLIMEAIDTLKDPGGSDKTTIGGYIEGQYEAPLEFKRLLSSKLKYLTSCGELIKVKRKYMIPNSIPLSSSHRKNDMSILSLPSPKTDRDEVIIQTRSQIDTEMARMKSMSVQEAAAVAALAVAEAEAAMAEADEASKEAEAAEAEAEAAQAFAEEALKRLKGRNTCKEMICA